MMARVGQGRGQAPQKKTSDIDKIAGICSTCGTCLFSCPVYNAELTEPSSPRGKVALIKAVMDGRLPADTLNKRFIYQCLVCGNCSHICPNGVDFVEMMIKYRSRLSAGSKIPLLKKVILNFYQSIFFRKFTWMVDILAKTPLRKTLSLPRRLKPVNKKNLFTAAKQGGNFDILLFPGCVLTYFYPALIEKIAAFLKRRGFSVVVPKNLCCCGFPYISQGWQKKFLSLKKKNRQIFSAFNFKYLVVPCSTGAMAFKNSYDLLSVPGENEAAGEPEVRKSPDSETAGIEIYDLTEFIYKFAGNARVDPESIASGNGKVTYHDPCHDLAIAKIEKQPRFFLKQFGSRFIDDKTALCCGFGGIFSVGFPVEAKKILKRKVDHLEEIGADTVVTSCPGCYYRLRENLRREVKFFIELF